MSERDLIDVVDAIRAGETSAEADMRVRIARIEKLNPTINAVLDLYADEALEQARTTDPQSLLAGVVLGHKNMIWRKGRRSTYGSKIMESHIPERTAALNEKLDKAGGIDLASLNMTEFAQGATGHNAHYGRVCNPWNPDRVTGGSSSGSAAAVASGMLLASLGSDTAGSIRLPASICGVTGLKPTWSRVSLDATMPLSTSFDCIGPLARSARDCARILGIIAGRDECDPISSRRVVPDYEAALTGDIAGQRIGVPCQFFFENVTQSIGDLFEAALDVFKARGAIIVPVDMPAIGEIGLCLTLALRSEIAAQHADWLAYYRQDYAPQLGKRMLAHQTIPAVTYVTAMRKRAEFLGIYMRDVFDKVDALACPTLPISPPLAADCDLETDPDGALQHYGRIAQNGAFASFLGLPALSAPMGFCDQGMPAGLQLIGRPFGETRILKLADAYQRDTSWHRRMPKYLEEMHD